MEGSDAGSGGVEGSDAGSGRAGHVGGVFVVVVGVRLADFDFDVDWPLFSRLLANGPFFLMSLRGQ